MTLPEWMRKFGTDEACQDYLFWQRWPDGFVCARCQGQKSWTIQRSDRTAPLYECTARHYQVSLTVGTIFHRTKLALSLWFLAIFLMADDKRGLSALTLSRKLGLSYPTAWLMHHKIQQAMAERNVHYQLGGPWSWMTRTSAVKVMVPASAVGALTTIRWSSGSVSTAKVTRNMSS